MMEENDKLLSEFDEGIWIAIVDVAVVHSEREVSFIFKDGLELDWKI
jgi:site-specific DNA recombinase